MLKTMCSPSLLAVLAAAQPATAQPVATIPADETAASSSGAEPLDSATLDTLRELYKKLIDAEDHHDLAAVRAMVWKSPSALFVAKTATPAEGNWAGFWGTDVVVTHIGDLFKAGSFRIDPEYNEEKVVGLTRDVAETYVPVNISVAYAGQTPVPKPFLMILDWIKTPEGWRMATDIALPIPPPPTHSP
jgi:hypothetical protein